MLKFPKYAYNCINVLLNNGFEAYFVGGCVRDGLLSRPCYDIDITTNALPDEIMALFPTAIPTGIAHGTITVIQEGYPVEITTYRKEEGYKDNRHPDNVSFVSSLDEDLSRRDFTFNALACSKDGEIADLFGGINDLNNKLIRTVGEAEKRFEEDALRILRAYRFAATLGFEIECNTKSATLKLANNINNISGERILTELVKTANGIKPSVIFELLNTGALTNFGIEAGNENVAPVNKIHTLNLNDIQKASLFFTCINHNLENIKSQLKACNVLLQNINALDEMREHKIPNDKYDLKQLLYKYGIDTVNLYLNYLALCSYENSEFLFNILNEIINNKEAFKISDLAISGNDIMELGFSGAEVGQQLYKALLYVMKDNNKNQKEDILNHLHQ
ncbi:MAG: CCA tRNA nucleotidyltransferase [Clostridia bacterium]|nr:CCA tRNA nucleotidyltransferase [Clostridia bacterium]